MYYIWRTDKENGLYYGSYDNRKVGINKAKRFHKYMQSPGNTRWCKEMHWEIIEVKEDGKKVVANL
jgi:hypothetical protein